MPWKSTLSRVCQCPRISTQSESVLGLVPGFANAHGNPQIFAVPWMPWKSTLSQSTLIGPGFANAHAYPPSRIQCHVDAMEIHTIQGRVCQCPWTSTMDAMEIHTIQVYPYRARVCQCPCISYRPSLSQCHGCRLPWSSVLGLVPGFANAHGCHGNPHYPSLPL